MHIARLLVPSFLSFTLLLSMKRIGLNPPILLIKIFTQRMPEEIWRPKACSVEGNTADPERPMFTFCEHIEGESAVT